MMQLNFARSAAVPLFLFSIHTAWADECAIDKFKDNLNYSSSIYLKYFYASDYLKRHSNADKTDVGISIYDIFGLDYKNANSINDFVKNQENISIDYSQLGQYSASQLKDNDLKAYEACVESKNGFLIETSIDPAIKEDVSLIVKYYPRHDNRAVIITVKSVSNAVLDADNEGAKLLKTISRKSEANTEEPFVVHREINRPSQIQVIIENDSGQKQVKEYFIPEAPKFTYSIEDRIGKEVGYHAESTRDNPVITSCVKVRKDEGVIIPGTIHSSWAPAKKQWGGACLSRPLASRPPTAHALTRLSTLLSLGTENKCTETFTQRRA